VKTFLLRRVVQSCFFVVIPHRVSSTRSYILFLLCVSSLNLTLSRRADACLTLEDLAYELDAEIFLSRCLRVGGGVWDDCGLWGWSAGGSYRDGAQRDAGLDSSFAGGRIGDGERVQRVPSSGQQRVGYQRIELRKG
jgi:hypothetical protein